MWKALNRANCHLIQLWKDLKLIDIAVYIKLTHWCSRMRCENLLREPITGAMKRKQITWSQVKMMSPDFSTVILCFVSFGVWLELH